MQNSDRGKISYTTYYILIALQCLGLPLALLVSPPNKIIRPGGEGIPDPTKGTSMRLEFRKLGALVKRREIYLLIPILIGFQWNSVYVGIYLTD